MTGGSKPTIQNSGGDGIALAANNLVRRLTAGNASGFHSAGSNVGTLTVSEVIVNNATGGGIEVATGTLAVTLQSLTNDSSSDEGIDLTAVAGSFTVSAGSVNNTNSPGDQHRRQPVAGAERYPDQCLIQQHDQRRSTGDTTGSFTVTGTGVTDGTGGNDPDHHPTRFEAISAQNIALSNMNFTNATTGQRRRAGQWRPAISPSRAASPTPAATLPIYLETVTGVSPDQSDDQRQQNGINGNLVTNFSLVNSDPSNIGSEPGERRPVPEPAGTNTFNNVSIVGSFTQTKVDRECPGLIDHQPTELDHQHGAGTDGFFVKGASRDGNNATITFNVTDSSFTQNQASQPGARRGKQPGDR